MITKEMIDRVITKALEKMVGNYNELEGSQVAFDYVGPLVYMIDGGYQHGAFDISVVIEKI